MRIEFDSTTQTLTVDGVKVSLEVLVVLAHPDPGMTYTFERIDDTTWATQHPRQEQ